MTDSLDDQQMRIAEWSNSVFDPWRGVRGPLSHLKKECDEAIENPNDIMEFADCYMLLIDAASQAGHRITDIVLAAEEKLEICKSRQWGKPDENGTVEHIRDE